MRLLAPLFFSASALAFSFDLRDPKLISRQSAGDIQRDLVAVTAATDALGAAIRNFNGPDTALAVNGAAGAVTDALKKGTSDANAIPSISQDDALTLSGPTNDLNAAVNRTITALISKKNLFVQNGFGEIVLNTLLEQQKASTAFTTAIVSKLPEGIRGIAANLSKPAADALAAGIAAFQGAGKGGSSGGGASPPSYGGGSPQVSGMGSMQPSVQPSKPPASVPPAAYTPPPAAYTPTKPAYTPPPAAYTPPAAATPSTTAPAQYTGAAMPTAAAGFGAVAFAAIAGLAVL